MTTRIVLLSLLFLMTASNHAVANDMSPGFHATLTGAETAEIEADGVFKCIPPRKSFGETRPGYFFLADGQGVRDYGITFTLPILAEVGSHALQPHSPFDVGKIYEARIDVDVPDEKRTASYQTNPEGALTLTSVVDGSGINPVEGSFEFSIENTAGDRIRASGSFHLPAERIRKNIADLGACYGTG